MSPSIGRGGRTSNGIRIHSRRGQDCDLAEAPGEPARILKDMVEGCVLSGSPADGTRAVDQTSTETCRSALAAGHAGPPPNACRFGQG